MAGLIPTEFAKVNVSVGDKNANGLVDITAEVVVLGFQIVPKATFDIDPSDAFALVRKVADFGGLIRGLLPK